MMTATMKERIDSSFTASRANDVFLPSETAGKIQAGIDSFRRREGRPASEVFANLRKKHGVWTGQ